MAKMVQCPWCERSWLTGRPDHCHPVPVTSNVTSKDTTSSFVMAGNTPIFFTHYHLHLANGSDQEVDGSVYDATSVGQPYTYSAEVCS